MRYGGGFATAVGLLTRWPVSPRSRLSRGVPWFPVVGALLGLAAAGVYALAYLVLPPLLAATAAVAAALLMTGGLHEDGLADYADALGSGAEPQRALEILRDPRVGTFGALALIISVAWRITAVSELGPVEAAAALVMANALARSGAAGLIAAVPAARTEGLGWLSRDAGRGQWVGAAVAGLAIGALSGGVWVVAAVIIAAGAVLGVGNSARRRFGGMTGDVLGACEQVIEISLLTLAVVAQGLDFPLWDGFL